MDAETKEKVAVGLDVTMGVCYGLRRWLAPSNSNGNTAKSLVNETLEEEIKNIDAIIEKAKEAKSEVKDFLQQPEVKLAREILKVVLKKRAQKKAEERGEDENEKRSNA